MTEHKVSAYRVAKDLGFSQSLLPNWKKGVAQPKQDKIKLIADYFNVPVEYFYENMNEPYTQDPTVAHISMKIANDKRLMKMFNAACNMSTSDLDAFNHLMEKWSK